jgi:MscS family membrane protein
VWGQAFWKLIALVVVLVLFVVFMGGAYRLSRGGSSRHPVRKALAQLVFPLYFLLAVPVVAYLACVQINLRGNLGGSIELVATLFVYLSGAWILWRIAPVVGEVIILSPRIAPEGIDAHLIRICTRLMGIVGGAVLLAMGANQEGIPVYGIIAGLGVGGLAIALSAQPTIENLIGGLSLFADKPIVVGDLCRCGSDEGTVEAIGIRSTRIRGLDRTVTSIPNALLSKMAIMNFAQRDRMLIKAVLGVRYETSSEQLRCLLVKIRGLLSEHPRVSRDLARVRFIGFGASSLEVEVVAHVMTSDKAEFLEIQEDIWLRVMDIVEQSGTGFAVPAPGLTLLKDHEVHDGGGKRVAVQVGRKRDEGSGLLGA